ncbi:MAG: lysylphosphatidylglycerol synthase domain-containing protein, partial [Actinomycetota bacterium]|nr:lysylphosphatidylglycerol synthase domain-containing protein [Actinomycetota bacterium]
MRERVRRLAGWALALAVLAALVVLGISKIDLGQVGRALAHVRLGWVAVAFLLMAGTLFSRAQSWHVAIGAALGRGTVGRLTVTRVMFIGMFGSTVAPG